MWLKRQNLPEQVHVTCHSWELQTSLRIQSGTATWAGAKAWQYQILQAITNIVKQTLWRITDKISGLKGWKAYDAIAYSIFYSIMDYLFGQAAETYYILKKELQLFRKLRTLSLFNIQF